tara:strand:- start:658 stop:3438 length:2781 start_codon:yes stop_codon:yes gene_type:complete
MSFTLPPAYSNATKQGNIAENFVTQLYHPDTYLTFDGTDDHVDLGATTSSSAMALTSTTKMSIAFWVNFPVLGSTEFIFSNNSSANYAGVSVYKDSSDKISWLMGENTGTSSSDRETMYADTALSANTWYFIVIVTDFTTATRSGGNLIYINNSSATVANSGSSGIETPVYTSGNAYIGRRHTTYGQFKLKNFALWGTELNSDNITAIYNSGNIMSLAYDSGNYNQSSNLKGYWECNQGNNVIQDTTGYSSTGSITGAIYEDYLPLALSDTTVDDVFYPGVITQKPIIRSSLDLSKSTAKTGNVSLSVVNYNYKGDDFSAELFLGSKKYINRNVKIYSQLNANSSLSNCFQVYNGRLIDISHDESMIKLTLTEQRPWDFISIPLPADLTTIARIPVPVAYGSYSSSANSYYDTDASSHDLDDMVFETELTNTALRPCPLNNATDNFRFFVADKSAKSDSRAEYWDSGLQKFIPINSGSDAAITTSVSNDGQFCTKSEIDLKRAVKIRPATVAISENNDSISTSNIANMIDADSDWKTSKATIGANSAPLDTEVIKFQFTDAKVPQGEIVQAKIYVTTELENVSGSGAGVGINILADGATSQSLVAHPPELGASRAKTTDSVTITNFPSLFTLRIIFYQGITATAHIYNVMIAAEYKTEDDKTDFVYIGADGNTESWTGSNGAIEHGHEAHRDMLIRYTGYTAVEPENWSALHTDRHIDTFKMRFWETEAIDLKKILEKIQLEFGFIFKFRPDSTGSYIYIKQTSELSAVQTFNKHDIKNLNISNSPFSELQTKMVINYTKHPADNKYLNSVTSTNTTARANWNIQDKENINDVKLDMNIGTPNTTGQTDPNSDFYSYYDNIFGDIKRIVNFEAVNPAKSYNLETGDIIQFTDMPVDPFGGNWNDYYMITDLQRGVGTVKIQAREVG